MRHFNRQKSVNRLTAVLLALALVAVPFAAVAGEIFAACAPACCCCGPEEPGSVPAVSLEKRCACAAAPIDMPAAPAFAAISSDKALRVPMPLVFVQWEPSLPHGMANRQAALLPAELSPPTPVALHARINC